MQVLGVIPARYGSTRFEGKLLKLFEGKTVIEHVYQRAKKASLLDDLLVAADDKRIFEAVESFGGKVVMTAADHVSGTDRIIEAIGDLNTRLVINIQGDEPLLVPEMVDQAALPLLEDKNLEVSTLVKTCTDPDIYNDPNVVKAVLDKQGYAIYFSRHPIPHGGKIFYVHVGIYGYTKEFLLKFKDLPVSDLEKAERLEQLRILENGYRIKASVTEYETIGVDTPEDLEKIKQRYK